MKKVLGVLIVLTILIMGFSTRTFAASEPTISFDVDGTGKKGEKIIINVMVKDVVNLYAASVDYIYNPEFLKVNFIESDGLIKESDLNLMEPGGETNKDGNRANYQMTFTGKVEGISGSGKIVKIEAEVLNDFEIELTEENMKIKLVDVDKNYNVNRISFIFDSLETEDTITNENAEESINTENGENESDLDENINNSTNGEYQNKDEATSENNTFPETAINNEDEIKPSKPSLIDKFINIFKKDPEVKLDENKNYEVEKNTENKDEATSEDNKSVEISTADIDKIKPSKPSLIDKFINIFKENPEVELDENINNSTNAEYKNDEVKKNNMEILESDSEELANNSENKEESDSNNNIFVIILVSLIVMVLIVGVSYLVIKKKHNN